MKIHIAARRDCRPRAQHAAARLTEIGHQVVSRWLASDREAYTLGEEARYTLNDVVAADCLVLLCDDPRGPHDAPGSYDRHVELGYALKASKRICLLGGRETLYYHLPEVERYRTVEELCNGLR